MSSNISQQVPQPLLSAGRSALVRGDWQEARAVFETALRQQEKAETLDGLGLAAWWLNDAAVVFHARERAYQLYRTQGSLRSAARVAAWLAMDYFYFRGEYAIANGWIQRGRRLVEDLEPGPELGWLDLAQAHVIMWAELDYAAAQQWCTQAVALGKTLADVDLEMAGLAGEGLSLVNQGLVGEGMRRLDQATLAAVAGDVGDVDAACTACCCLIFACEWTRDYERAAQWVERLRELATRWSHPTLLAFCQVHYASLLIWQGDWAAAETELLAATGDLAATQQPARVADGLVRLADLRCRQGLFDEADALFARIESPAFKSLAGSYCLYGRAALALAQDDPETAVNLVERFLRALPPENRLERIAALELLIQAQARRSYSEQVGAALAEMKTAVANVSTKPMQAAVYFAEGLAAALADDHDNARRCFEDAAELWARAGIPFETARARLELARSLLALGQSEAAQRQAAKAADTFVRLGAAPDQARAAVLLRQIETASQEKNGRSASPAALTMRELEVVRLLAAGHSNQEISRELVLSVRTVERHISNIYSKIGVTGPSARAAAAAFAIQNDLV
jgi:LuxR family transcriptional regulator, maltose regulon positive regulatory protein